MKKTIILGVLAIGVIVSSQSHALAWTNGFPKHINWNWHQSGSTSSLLRGHWQTGQPPGPEAFAPYYGFLPPPQYQRPSGSPYAVSAPMPEFPSPLQKALGIARDDATRPAGPPQYYPLNGQWSRFPYLPYYPSYYHYR